MTTCNAIVRTEVGDFGIRWLTCRQVVGINSFISTGGLRVGYCRHDGHEASVRRQFAEQQDPPEPDWLHDHPEDATFEMPEGLDPITAAKGELARWGA